MIICVYLPACSSVMPCTLSLLAGAYTAVTETLSQPELAKNFLQCGWLERGSVHVPFTVKYDGATPEELQSIKVHASAPMASETIVHFSSTLISVNVHTIYHDLSLQYIITPCPTKSPHSLVICLLIVFEGFPISMKFDHHSSIWQETILSMSAAFIA